MPIKLQCVTIQMRATEQHFHAILFIIMYKVVLTFESVDESLVCDHSNQWKLLSGTFLRSTLCEDSLENKIYIIFQVRVFFALGVKRNYETTMRRTMN